MTTVGVLTVERRYWQCRCGADGGYAADAVVGLSGRYSRVVQQHCCRLAADGAFGRASDTLRALLDVRLAAETVRQVALGHGAAMAAFQPTDAATAEAFRTAKGEVEFAVDAGKVNTREDGWRDLKIVVISKRPAGAAATPEQWADERLPAAGASVAFAAIAPVSTFRRFWRSTLRRLGVTTFATVHALGDGASWIWKAVGRVLTGCQQTLDIYHACEHLSRCAQSIFGEGTSEAKAAFERGRELLLSEGWNGVCRWVGELRAVDDEQAAKREQATAKVLGYFSAHVGRLNYRERLARGRAIGSGVVEGQAKTLGLRLKARGARWRKTNVKAMASLVNVRNSMQWEAYWALAA